MVLFSLMWTLKNTVDIEERSSSFCLANGLRKNTVCGSQIYLLLHNIQVVLVHVLGLQIYCSRANLYKHNYVWCCALYPKVQE